MGACSVVGSAELAVESRPHYSHPVLTSDWERGGGLGRSVGRVFSISVLRTVIWGETLFIPE